MFRLSLLLALALLHTAAYPQPPTDAVVVTEFADRVIDPGGEGEDWQPAFQAAIEQARADRAPLYVPAGEYAIRQPITIIPEEVEGSPYVRNNVRMIGAGKFKTFIRQQVETENCIDWTGFTYEEPATHGHLSGMTLSGGATALNIRWHNYFSLSDCYIVAAVQNGIHAEGWSSRFEDCVVRWCRNTGFLAAGHFNNCVIRDFYFSRNVVGLAMSGVHGSRVESCGFESCARAAIIVRNTYGLTISNSYFEGNGRRANALPFDETFSANTLHLDTNCHAIRVHDCIFRKNIAPAGGLISIADCRGGHIYDNYFYNYNPGGIGIILRGTSEFVPERPTVIEDVVIERNWHEGISAPITEAREGLYDAFVAAGNRIDWPLTPWDEALLEAGAEDRPAPWHRLSCGERTHPTRAHSSAIASNTADARSRIIRARCRRLSDRRSRVSHTSRASSGARSDCRSGVQHTSAASHSACTFGSYDSATAGTHCAAAKMSACNRIATSMESCPITAISARGCNCCSNSAASGASDASSWAISQSSGI